MFVRRPQPFPMPQGVPGLLVRLERALGQARSASVTKGERVAVPLAGVIAELNHG